MERQMPRRIHPVIGRACTIGASVALAVLVWTPTRASAQATLSGCYVPNSGTVYRIKADGLPDSCRSKQHVEFTWSLQGPAGPAGPAGPTGPTGPQGVAGPAGGLTASGFNVVESFSNAVAPGTRGEVQAS